MKLVHGSQSYLIGYLKGVKMDINVLAVRAFKTFLQAFLAVLSVSVLTVVDVETGKAALIAAVAAGISATMNLFIKPTEAK